MQTPLWVLCKGGPGVSAHACDVWSGSGSLTCAWPRVLGLLGSWGCLACMAGTQTALDSEGSAETCHESTITLCVPVGPVMKRSRQEMAFSGPSVQSERWGGRVGPAVQPQSTCPQRPRVPGPQGTAVAAEPLPSEDLQADGLW